MHKYKEKLYLIYLLIKINFYLIFYSSHNISPNNEVEDQPEQVKEQKEEECQLDEKDLLDNVRIGESITESLGDSNSINKRLRDDEPFESDPSLEK